MANGQSNEQLMFRLTDSDAELLGAQNVMPLKKHLGGHLSYVFTEQGVADIPDRETKNLNKIVFDM